MSAGLDNLQHIVVVMMENRSFDHMLGALRADDPRINGLTGNETNPDTTNEPALVKAQPLADFHGQLDPDPDHSFPAVQKQLYFGTAGPPAAASMQGFVQSYFDQLRNVRRSHQIMYYFKSGALPVLHTLARSFAVFNGWFSSVPGPAICNHIFAHYGTSFGKVGIDPHIEATENYVSIYDRLLAAGQSAKLYYFDQASSTMEGWNWLSGQPWMFATYDQFLVDCRAGRLPAYSFLEPNYKDHLGHGGGELLASDQHPNHDVRAGEQFIATIYNAIRQNPELWKSTVLLITYSQHGGIYDHVPPPDCMPDSPFVASAQETGTGSPFAFDRLGVRVPAILVSPWIPPNTVVPGPEDPVNGRVFEHASIPATITRHFIGSFDNRSPREKAAATFLDLLEDKMQSESSCPVFISQ
jgi:phospholipase C